MSITSGGLAFTLGRRFTSAPRRRINPIMLSILTALLLGTASPEAAQPVSLVCNARDNSARILRSPAPNDIHPDWAGDTIVGTGQGLKARRSVTDDGGRSYLQGDIYSTRGGLLNRGVFVLREEWECRRGS